MLQWLDYKNPEKKIINILWVQPEFLEQTKLNHQSQM